MTVTLKLWVSNQGEGAPYDCTQHYLMAAHWQPPAGIRLDFQAQTLSGEPHATWRAYRSLAQAVTAAGHGSEDADEPILTACPEWLQEEGYTCAAESLARLESTEQETWEDFCASVPSIKHRCGE